jgi:hypothetical protein
MIIVKVESYMKIKLVLMICILLISLNLVSAEVNWENQWTSYWQNDFRRSVPVVGFLFANSPETTMMLFYPVESWEVKVCTQHVTTEKAKGKYSGRLPSDTKVWFNGSTVAVSASKYKYGTTNTTLYSMEWYVIPLQNNMKYTVYLKESNGDKYVLPGYKDVSVNLEGASGLDYSYYEANYTKIGISYTILDSYGELIGESKILEADIVLDTEAVYE